ncbi:TPA: hypothetical protein HA361_05235 [Candidatus Woesearchaeota archaeon]|nr:hypothetical protein [Candidatus Woesearchaeota archaeon]HII68333.1 hypothetical protein [Candidatus Woesearchaeota archaeon]
MSLGNYVRKALFGLTMLTISCSNGHEITPTQAEIHVTKHNVYVCQHALAAESLMEATKGVPFSGIGAGLYYIGTDNPKEVARFAVASSPDVSSLPLEELMLFGPYPKQPASWKYLGIEDPNYAGHPPFFIEIRVLSYPINEKQVKYATITGFYSSGNEPLANNCSEKFITHQIML